MSKNDTLIDIILIHTKKAMHSILNTMHGLGIN